jgi:NIMA (never in mitosis gene a)-related kinase
MYETKKTFSELQIMSWLKQICSALAYLESKKIIHHDLKPANIFIYGDQIKIGDFGLSKTLGSR